MDKDKNAVPSESSLLLQLPNSMYSFSDMSGNSFLMPVAIEPSVDVQSNLSNVGSNSDKSGGSQKLADNASVCQLEQPLLMRKASSPAPVTQPNASSVASIQPVTSYTGPPVQPPSLIAGLPLNVGPPHNAGPPTHSVVNNNKHTFQSGTVFTGPPAHSTDSHYYSSPPEYQISSANSSPQVASTSSAVIEPASVSAPASPFMQPSREPYKISVPPPDYYSKPRAVIPNSSFSDSSVYGQPTTTPNPRRINIPYADLRLLETIKLPYQPPKVHWLYRDIVESKEIWVGFNNLDSVMLECVFQTNPHSVVPTDGGRYDAYLDERIKRSVYFDAKDLHIRRGTWFYKADSSQRHIPFEEEIANLLEQNYHQCVTSGQWQKRVNLPGVGSVVLENPEIILQYKNELDVWPSLPDSKGSPKPLKRGLPEGFQLMPEESPQIDHLVFIVQGIGSFCDLRFRTVSQCVDGFRDIANRLLLSHFKPEVESERIGRIEFLPLAWHAKLHTSDIGLDRRMQKITLPSIPKLRHFTNDTLLDILLYSSPSYCQSIIDTVSSELNKLYEIFLSRNPGFCGKVCVAGHSLGSLILFDILANQKLPDDGDQTLKEAFFKSGSSESYSRNSVEANGVLKAETFPTGHAVLESFQLSKRAETSDKTDIYPLEENDSSTVTEKTDENVDNLDSDIDKIPANSVAEESHMLKYPLPSVKASSSVIYPRLHFKPACFFALGSPISMFLAVRGYDTISEDFRFPTCPSFFHIFHPYDPVAFRIEPLIDPNFCDKPVLIPHHKGRKRMHLEIRENIAKVGTEIKQKVMETLKYTWSSLSGFARARTFPTAVMEATVSKLMEEQGSESECETQAPSEASGEDIQIGCLNGGRRIDFVLQEKPIEALNDYIFALTSHATYWDSEDTVLMILREIYAMEGIIVSSQADDQRQCNIVPEDDASDPLLQSVISQIHSIEFVESDNIKKDLQNIPPGFPPVQNMPPVLPTSVSSAHTPDIQTNLKSTGTNIAPSPRIPAKPLGPPPLSGFVKRSPFAR